jgi:hypothetical protein
MGALRSVALSYCFGNRCLVVVDDGSCQCVATHLILHNRELTIGTHRGLIRTV